MKFEGAYREEFIRAVGEALHLVQHGWMVPLKEVGWGDKVFIRNGAEPPHVGIVLSPKADQLWEEETDEKYAGYVRRVEVSYHVERGPSTQKMVPIHR